MEKANESTCSQGVTVSFETYGCSANHADTALLKHHAEESGLSIIEGGEAEVVVLNSCTVKGPTQTAIERRIRELSAAGKKVVVAGCFSQSSPSHPLLKDLSLLGPDTVDQIGAAVNGALSEKPVQITKRKRSPLPLVPPAQAPEKPFVLSVSQGCLSSCSFCMTKLARGNLRSHTVRHLRDVTEEAIKRGHREVYLTSQDTSAYGLDIGTDLVHLLEALIEIPGDFSIRIGMANPQHFHHFQARLWPLFDSEKLYRFLHIPLQSGSEAVLEHMRREHTATDYLDLVAEGRGKVPELSIATDIICGYPTETESDHHDTLSALRMSQPDAVNISRYWPRPGTRAEKLKELPGGIVKSRTKDVSILFHRISRSRNRKWLGWNGKVQVTEFERGQYRGRNQSYKQVLLPRDSQFEIGQRVPVTISDYSKFDLRAS